MLANANAVLKAGLSPEAGSWLESYSVIAALLQLPSWLPADPATLVVTICGQRSRGTE